MPQNQNSPYELAPSEELEMLRHVHDEGTAANRPAVMRLHELGLVFWDTSNRPKITPMGSAWLNDVGRKRR